MGISHGPKGPMNMTDKNHRAWVKQVLHSNKKGRALHYEVGKYLDCDVLFDHPDKKHAARLFIWWSATSSPQIDMNDMLWFKPYMRFAQYNYWTSKDAYGKGAAYAKDLAKLMNLRVHESVRDAQPKTRMSIKKNRRVTFA
jgi:hypothetical protein